MKAAIQEASCLSCVWVKGDGADTIVWYDLELLCVSFLFTVRRGEHFRASQSYR